VRLLHVGKFFPPHPGGIERVCAELAAASAEHGVATAVLAHAEPGTWRTRTLGRDGVEVRLVACPGRLLYAPVSPSFPWQLDRLVRRFRPDLLHLHVPNTSAFWALFSPAARRVPWIVHWHADIPLDSRHGGLRLAYRLYRPWERALLARAHAIVATSEPYRDSSTALAAWRNKVQVIPLGIPDATDTRVAPSSSLSWPGAGLRILAVGRLSYFKGFDVLLRALAEVEHASLLLVGDGECRGKLERLARELGIAARVRFAGRVDMSDEGQAALAAAYAAADVFCLPSTERAESFGLVLLEAMRAGVPVVASAIAGSGVGYVVRDGETGLLVPPGDARALAAALGRLLADAPQRKRFGEAGRERWRAEFTLERSVARTLALYRAVLADRDSGSRAPAM